MTDSKKSHSENTYAVLRSAIRDGRASCVEARIRITRINRGIEKLRRSKKDARDESEIRLIEMKLRQNLKLRERVNRGLASTEADLQKLLQMEQKERATYQPVSMKTSKATWVPTGTEL
ncbi:MAG: hypothetical protein AAF542_22125 [Pseudomonadota bacterium]